MLRLFFVASTPGTAREASASQSAFGVGRKFREQRISELSHRQGSGGFGDAPQGRHQTSDFVISILLRTPTEGHLLIGG